MDFEHKAFKSNLKEEIESVRRASFRGYDTILKGISDGMDELKREKRGAYFPIVTRDISHWAQTYRGYRDEDSFYELIAELQMRIADYIDHEDNLKNKDDFLNGMYKIIDETFPQKA